MMPHGAYEDGELEISLASSANRRAQGKPADASFRRDPNRERRSVEQPPPQRKADQRIGAYQIIRTLGEGSFGKVKLAVHRVTNQQVALKIIARKKLISRDMAGRVEREIEYLQLLRHPHIIKLYTVIKTQQEIIMVLEYAGGELFDYIVQHGKMKEDEARRFFQQIICAVEYCHRHKIVHRDLKPENLLLDENLNVKIADFGLSNIMTDGNFLKTSCGSPNYAAPEVINGKLYAGPEVDVWSCGVILYVLLVGRLPFDDEHIPSLFAKIAKGQYVVPNYMSAGAASLIKKMLAVNPVHRATIEEIRQDPWFLVNLPAYLRPPPEEFFDTGVDPSKAINPRSIAPHATPAVQEKLHEQVTEKISKTMGYGIKDVQEALAAEEPSAIKDAYLIVRENKLMESNPLLADDKGQLLFQASSPPPWNDGIKLGADSPVSKDKGSVSPLPLTRPSPLLDSMSPRSSTSAGTERSIRPYVSKVGILPSSLPAYHKDYMQAKKAGRAPINSTELTQPDVLSVPQSEAEKIETARRLNPHSRSQIKLDEANKRPVAMTPVPQKKAKPTKWQFGIRSRNQPLEAIGCIYRALQKLGAEWVLDEDGGDSRSVRNDDNRNDGSFVSEASGASLHHADSMNGRESSNIRFQSAASVNYKLPADPWVLHVRWKQDGMYPPGKVPPGSTHSSALDLRRPSIASLSSGGGSVPSQEAASSSPKHNNHQHVDTQSVVMYMDIQLYEMESGVYLVDFKCAGYETADGMLLEEKDVTSPFPFLDLASKLIIQLAEAD
ncbi:BcSNF1, Snf1-like protein kinase [Xylogone sp. PMI_703]|nr:BcSNF1, Snf1-like protein kinase [Xylogone sp. PMI_703]